jgi:hypothetical protein
MRKVGNSAARFQKFVGRVVACTEVKTTMELMGEQREFVHAEYDHDDATIQAIKKMVGDERLRIFTPGRDLGTCDYWSERINVSISKDEDGTFKVVRITNG